MSHVMLTMMHLRENLTGMHAVHLTPGSLKTLRQGRHVRYQAPLFIGCRCSLLVADESPESSGKGPWCVSLAGQSRQAPAATLAQTPRQLPAHHQVRQLGPCALVGPIGGQLSY